MVVKTLEQLFLIVTDTAKIEALKRAFGKKHLLDADGKNCTFKCPNPKCGSHAKDKLKFVIRVEDSACHCWVCDLRGKSSIWIAKRWSPGSVDRLAEVYHLDRGTPLRGDECETPEEAYTLPEDFRLIAPMVESGQTRDPAVRSVLAYLINRGLTVRDMWRYKVGISSATGYRGSALFPSFSPVGEVEFCLARTTDPDAFRKYKNHGAKSSKIIYDEIHVDFQDTVHLFEGVFDLVRSRLNGTALLGSSLPTSGKLFERLAVERPPVVLCLDADVQSKSSFIANKLAQFGVDVKVASLPEGKDPGSMEQHELLEAIQAAKPFTWNDPLLSKIKNIRSGTIL